MKPLNGSAGNLSPPMGPDTLRKLNHAEWLKEAATVFETQWLARGIEMTPFRMGIVTRLKLASDYITLLQGDLAKSDRKISEAAQVIVRQTVRVKDLERKLNEGEGR